MGNRKTRSLNMTLSCLLLAAAAPARADLCKVGETLTTSVGAKFDCVRHPGFGAAWRDPSGNIWSAAQGSFSNSGLRSDAEDFGSETPAERACAKIGGTLPSAVDYDKLSSDFETKGQNLLTEQGKRDLDAILSDSKKLCFWSSYGDPDQLNNAYAFCLGGGTKPGIYAGSAERGRALPVRCVTR